MKKLGISKFGIMKMKSGGYYHSEGIQLPNDEEMKKIDQVQEYQYLGVLDADDYTLLPANCLSVFDQFVGLVR